MILYDDSYDAFTGELNPIAAEDRVRPSLKKIVERDWEPTNWDGGFTWED